MVQERPGDNEHDEIFYTMTVKTDYDGSLLWQKTESGFSSMRQTYDGGYITVKGNRLIKLGTTRPEAKLEKTPLQSEQTAKIPQGDSRAPGFGWVVVIAGMLAVVYLRLRWKRN